jgi:hypothetical protein
MREFRGEVKTKKEKDPTLKHSFLFSHSPAHTHRRKKRKKIENLESKREIN